MLRISLLAFAYSVAVMAQKGLPDPDFDRIPFERWLNGGSDAHIRWAMDVFPSRLGVHQRLRVGLSARIDAGEFVKRRGRGQMVVFVEIRDRDNNAFRTHLAVHFRELKNPKELAAISFDLYALMLPGDYQLAIAVYDSASKQHNLKKTKLHVPELAHDPLARAWRNLPEVEFVTNFEPPDSWYRPEITSRLYLPVQNKRPVRVEVVVNESPTEATKGVARAIRRNMENLIPALKVLSQMEIKNGSLNVTLLDLERRKVSFNQEHAGELDWTRLRAALLDNDPNQIDVHALENHEQNAQFFVSEIRKRLESTEPNGDDAARVLIVLSGPMAFPRGQDLRPIEASPEPGARVFYLRFSPPRLRPARRPMVSGGRGAGPPRSGSIPISPGPSVEDSLAGTLKPLAPRTFDVTTPMEFRSALTTIMSEISRLK